MQYMTLNGNYQICCNETNVDDAMWQWNRCNVAMLQWQVAEHWIPQLVRQEHQEHKSLHRSPNKTEFRGPWLHIPTSAYNLRQQVQVHRPLIHTPYKYKLIQGHGRAVKCIKWYKKKWIEVHTNLIKCIHLHRIAQQKDEYIEVHTNPNQVHSYA